MAELNTVDEILDFAIEREQEAADFYSGLATRARTRAMKGTFEQFAGEERGHKAKLQSVKAGKKLLSSQKKIRDLKIGDYLVDEEPTEDIDYQDALILAMKKEKAAFRLYSDLAAKVDDAEIKGMLLGLAQEEAKHKLRFELEYDENVLTDN
jgi:rubrerythrin